MAKAGYLHKRTPRWSNQALSYRDHIRGRPSRQVSILVNAYPLRCLMPCVCCGDKRGSSCRSVTLLLSRASPDILGIYPAPSVVTSAHIHYIVQPLCRPTHLATRAESVTLASEPMALFNSSRLRLPRISATSLSRTAPCRSRAPQAQLSHLIRPRFVASRPTPSYYRQPKRSYSQPPPSRPNPTPNLNSPEPHSFTARLKKLSREYGWTVVGVYLALTVADLPLCFLTVNLVGAERVAYAEHVLLDGAKTVIQKVFPDAFQGTLEEKVDMEAAEANADAAEAEKNNPSECTTHLCVLR